MKKHRGGDFLSIHLGSSNEWPLVLSSALKSWGAKSHEIAFQSPRLRKKYEQPAPPCTDIERADKLTILGVVIDSVIPSKGGGDTRIKKIVAEFTKNTALENTMSEDGSCGVVTS